MLTTIVVLVSALLISWLVLAVLRPTHESHHIRLGCSPNRISASQIGRLVVVVLLKQLPGYGAQISSSDVSNSQVRLVSLQTDGELEVDSSDRHRFDRAMRPIVSASPASSPSDNKDDLTDRINPFFLIALTGPLVIALLADPSCPINPVGAVNTHNTFTLDDTTFCRSFSAIRQASLARRLTFQARMGGPQGAGVRHRRGLEFGIVIDINHDGKRVMRQELSFLHFSKRLAVREPRATDDNTSKTESEPVGDAVRGLPMTLDVAAPRRWAAVCKDYNPIHVSTILARLFGYRSVIAHGNHVAALALEQLRSGEIRATVARRLCWESTPPMQIEVKFARPVVLPRTVEIEWRDYGDARAELNVTHKGKVLVTVSSTVTT